MVFPVVVQKLLTRGIDGPMLGSRFMKVICCQTNIVWEDKPANYARVRSMLDGYKPAPGSMVVLPEMFASGFSMNVPTVRDGKPAETEAFLSSAAQQYGVYMVGGVISPGPHDRGRNEALVFNPKGKMLARYCKIHPFTLGGESQHYAGGNEIVTFKCNHFVVAPFICYDLRFPELFRAVVKKGVHLFVVIANWPIKRVDHWVTLLRARAIENLAYVVGVNRSGVDPNYTYPGRSIIVDPHGEIIVDAGKDEGIIQADLSLEEVTSWRKDFPALKDMHSEPFKI